MKVQIRSALRRLSGAVVVTAVTLIIVAAVRTHIHNGRESVAVTHVRGAGGDVKFTKRERHEILQRFTWFWDCLWHGAPCDRIAVVSFTGGDLTQERVDALSRFGTKVTLLLTDIPVGDLGPLSSCDNLTQLVVDPPGPPDNIVGGIPVIDILQGITIRNARVEARTVNGLAAVPMLSQLVLQNCDVEGHEPVDFNALKNLRDLRIYRSRGKNVQLLAQIPSCATLEHLELWQMDLCLHDAKRIAANDHLRVLGLVGTTIRGGNIGVFCGTKLSQLWVAEGQLTDQEIASFHQRMPACAVNQIRP
jgi:hypothetical protein